MQIRNEALRQADLSVSARMRLRREINPNGGAPLEDEHRLLRLRARGEFAAQLLVRMHRVVCDVRAERGADEDTGAARTCDREECTT